MSLAARLFWFALAAMCPVFAVVLLFQYQLADNSTAEVRAGLARQLTQARSDVLRLVEQMQTLLVSIGATKSVQAFDDAQCTPFLQRVAKSLPQVSSIGVLDLNGNVRCIDDPERGRPNYADREYFRTALSSDAFTIGLLTAAKTDPSRRVLPFAMPLRGADGKPVGVIAVGLSIAYLNRIVGEWALPPGGSLTVADRDGAIIARNPLPERFIGTKIPDEFQKWLHAPTSGMAEALSQDGTKRLLAYSPLSEPPGGIYLSTGVATAVAYAHIWRAALWNLGAIAAGLLGVVAVSQLAGRYLIRAPAEQLISLAIAWTHGRPGAETKQTRGPREFLAIGSALNRMGSELAARARTAEASEERLRLTIQTAPYPLLVEADDGELIIVNDSWWQSAGFDPHQGGKPLPATWPNAKSDTLNPCAAPFDMSHHSGEWRFTGGDGSERVWQFGVVPLGTLPDGRRIRLLAGTDLTELKSAARRQQLLVDELNHRVKNTLAIVQAIAAQTAEHTADPDDFNLKFVERLQVLARTHDQLTARAWDSIPLADILEAELAAIRSPTAQVELSGDAQVLLPAQSALIAAMVFHELAVNALQHGCFQRPGGRLRVVWRATTRHDAGTDDDYVSIEWEETCTWALPAQGASGFGMRLLSRAGAALGSGTMAMRPEGVHVTLRIRVPGLSPPEVPSSPRREEALAG